MTDLPSEAQEAVERLLLEAATDCGHDGGWDGSGECPKHPGGSRFGFYNEHQVDITWRCWACLVELAAGWTETLEKLRIAQYGYDSTVQLAAEGNLVILRQEKELAEGRAKLEAVSNLLYRHASGQAWFDEWPERDAILEGESR